MKTRYGVALFVTLMTFLFSDMIWIQFVALNIFKQEVGHLLRIAPDFAAATAFYLIYGTGLTVLAVEPVLESRSLPTAITKGGALGLTAYATFDLTNLALLKGWTLKLVLIDMAWGTAASAIAAVVAVVIDRQVFSGIAPGARDGGR